MNKSLLPKKQPKESTIERLRQLARIYRPTKLPSAIYQA